jgi:ribosomal protein L40E
MSRMKTCGHCHTANPTSARYCMQCGAALPERADAADAPMQRVPDYTVLVLSLLGSIALSLILVFVFKLPIFFLAGFLPLLWARRK